MMVKLFVSHDHPSAPFNLIEFATATDNLDGTLSVCIIPASKVIVDGYLLRSRNTMNDSH